MISQQNSCGEPKTTKVIKSNLVNTFPSHNQRFLFIVVNHYSSKEKKFQFESICSPGNPEFKMIVAFQKQSEYCVLQCGLRDNALNLVYFFMLICFTKVFKCIGVVSFFRNSILTLLHLGESVHQILLGGGMNHSGAKRY